jgi:hypothetical protein
MDPGFVERKELTDLLHAEVSLKKRKLAGQVLGTTSVIKEKQAQSATKCRTFSKAFFTFKISPGFTVHSKTLRT